MFGTMKIKRDYNTAFSWFGMIGVAVFLIAWLCAAAVDTTWEFGVNTLSEFGISDTAASEYFNYGCMLTGLFVVLFGLGRILAAKNAYYTVGGTLLIMGGFFLAMVGVFTMDAGDTHYCVAIMMAFCMFAAVIAITAGNWTAGKKISAGAGIVTAFLLVTFVFAFEVAGLEAYGIILLMIWFLIECVNMILSGSKD
jgi:hypothetical membrane protein